MKSAVFALCLITSLAIAPLARAEQARDPSVAKAVELRGQAVAAFGAGDYDAAAELARRARAELALVKGADGAAPEQAPLPAYYAVRLLPEDRDSLSKIAGYPFVYGDRTKWIVLYLANKGTLRHPEDADIILPDEIIIIPSIAGEIREKAWSAEGIYPEFR
jgi:hypothetical protein